MGCGYYVWVMSGYVLLGGKRQTRWLCVLIKTVLRGNVYSVVLGL